MPLALFPFQELGADWIARRNRCGLLDVPGLGKSAQVIRAVDLRRLNRGIIICPAHLRSNWRGEWTKFGYFPRKIVIGRTLHDFVAWTRGIFDILIISYELATKWQGHFTECGDPIDFIALDEAHYLSNTTTNRTRAILGHNDRGLSAWASQVWWVTGTLMTNDPANCYSFLRFCESMKLSFEGFKHKFFYTRSSMYGERNRPRPETLPELQRLITNNSIRRTFENVGIELPPIFLTSTLVDGDTEHIRLLLSQHPGLDKAIVDALDSGGLSFLDSQHVATLRRLIAEAKALPYAEMLINELRQDPARKAVVMGNSREALQTVRDALAKHRIWCVLVQGGVADQARQDAIVAFQGNPDCRVFIGNMRSAGTGLTLTAAAHIDILESDWAPAVNDQAIKRIRRIGQRAVQHARFITLARSLDEVVNRVVAEKTRNIAMIEGDPMLSPPGAAA